MELNNAQRRTLRYYLRLHGTRPTLWSLIALVWRRYLLALVVGVVLPVILFGNTAPTYVLVGLTVGIFARDFGRFRAMAQMWPVLESIFDWDRIATLSAGERNS